MSVKKVQSKVISNRLSETSDLLEAARATLQQAVDFGDLNGGKDEIEAILSDIRSVQTRTKNVLANRSNPGSVMPLATREADTAAGENVNEELLDKVREARKEKFSTETGDLFEGDEDVA